MDIELLIKGFVGLVITLVVLIMIFLLPFKIRGKRKQSKQIRIEQKKEKEEQFTFNQIRSIVKNRNSTTKDLEQAIDQLIKYYIKIPPKSGYRSNPEFDKYIEIIFYLVRHENTNKNLVLKIDKALIKNNPEYKAQIDDALNKALTSRSG